MHFELLIWWMGKAQLLGSIFGVIISQVASGGVLLAIVGVVRNMLKKSE